MHPNELAIPSVRCLSPYRPGKPIVELQRELGLNGVVKLASNENPLGPSPKALAAASETLADLNLYPDGSGYQLKAALAAKFGVSPEQITLGNGSNDVLEIVARTFLGPGVKAVFSEYAFAIYPIITQAAGAVASVAPAHDGSRGPRYGHDLAALADLIDRETRLVFVANPNNPTGTSLNRAELHGFLADLPRHVVVVVDEAYFEYVTDPEHPDSLDWLDEFPNLVVTRTFSKAFGLAGLRVGYGVSSIAIAELLGRVRQPFNVNSVALRAAEAALADSDFLARSVRSNSEGLAQLSGALAARKLATTRSVGNFVCVDVGKPAAPVYQALLQLGVIVRPVANYGLANHLRVTVGSPDQNAAFLAALDRVLGL